MNTGHGLRARSLSAALLAALALSTLCGNAGAQAATRPAATALEAQVQSLQAQGFVGELQAARWQDGRPQMLLSRLLGLPVPRPVWRWASVSKQIAAALVLDAQQRGRLGLDDTVRTHWPDWPGPADVTLRQLMQHTSGLPNPDDTPAGHDGIPGFYRRGGAPAADAAGYCAAQPPAPAAQPAGQRFNYNNCDTLVLAEVLARIEGRPYRDLIGGLARTLGLRSLQMVEADEGPTPLPAGIAQPRLARFGAAAALHGSAADLLAWDMALLSGKLLREPARAALWAGEPRLGYAALGAWAFPATLRGCSATVNLVERRGDVGGVQVRNLLAPDQGVALVVFTTDAERDFGEIWQGRGLMFDLASAAVCGG